MKERLLNRNVQKCRTSLRMTAAQSCQRQLAEDALNVLQFHSGTPIMSRFGVRGVDPGT